MVLVCAMLFLCEKEPAHCRYDAVAKLGISSAKQHLQSIYPDGLALDTAFVNPAVVHQLDGFAEDAVASGSWCDLQALMPPALTHEDTTALLEHCSVLQSSGTHSVMLLPCHQRPHVTADAMCQLDQQAPLVSNFSK